MIFNFKSIAVVLVFICMAGFANAKADIDTFNEYNPIDDYVGIAQQGEKKSSVYVSCDTHLKDCPVRTYKHRDMSNTTKDRLVLKADSENMP